MSRWSESWNRVSVALLFVLVILMLAPSDAHVHDYIMKDLDQLRYVLLELPCENEYFARKVKRSVC